eukprot:TRINITY_DN1343_c0_g1_i1.p1 TRINITY_DN1343_c0_g1~~TRINITY_DN1343_c0_g1_i1.p1  ORF type:complete len:265 (-),score=87.82 TRINITY_DN1343_c0_g1_i1:101-895(-)
MNQLIKRLQKIEDDCVDKTPVSKEEEKNMDEFTRVKKKVAVQFKSIRQLIKDRDELESVNPGSSHTVEASRNIRRAMREVKTDLVTLDKLQKEEESKFRKKNKENPEKEQKIETRQEVVELAFKHMKECEALDKRRFGDTAFMGGDDGARDPVISELPDIDDEGFQQLRVNDKIIDHQLDQISVGVGRLKEIGLEMGKEVELQGQMLDNLDEHVEKVNVQLENINIRLRKTLDSIRKGDRFIVDIILLCLILGIGGYIYKMVKK